MEISMCRTVDREYRKVESVPELQQIDPSTKPPS